MKKLFFILFIAAVTIMQPVNAQTAEPVFQESQVMYSPSECAWSVNSISNDEIVLKKSVSPGSGNYSIYSYNSGQILLNSNYEFIYDSKLIGIDNENLKFYEIVYKDCNFEQKILEPDALKEIFHEAEIIKISEFKKGLYTVLSNNTSKRILLYNDTDLNFHKYFISPSVSIVDENVKALVQLPKKGKVKFSHIGDLNSQAYVIKVK